MKHVNPSNCNGMFTDLQLTLSKAVKCHMYILANSQQAISWNGHSYACPSLTCIPDCILDLQSLHLCLASM